MTYKHTKEQFLLIWNSNAYLNICTSDDMKIAISALDRLIPKPVVAYGDDEDDPVYCPCCHELIGPYGLLCDEFMMRGYDSMHCQECGQCITWE